MSELRRPASAHEAIRVPVIREPGGPTRRRFLQGAAAAAVGAGSLPTFLARRAGAASPIGATDGVVVVVNLLGGNDSLNTLTPIAGTDRGGYEALRATLALAPETLLPIGNDLGLHPALPRLAARYASGRVAIVQGVGTNGDLSHFTTQATMMAGTAGTSRASGWLGRYADGLTEWGGGLRSMAVGNTVPLHLVGTRVNVTALPAAGHIWGADSSVRWERSAQDCLRAFAAKPTGLGQWADRAASCQRSALDQAAQIAPLYAQALPPAALVRDLTLAARVINANLGTRCIATSLSGWDTHAMQSGTHGALLDQLDQAIDAFFGGLSPAFRDRTTLVVVSEFGRRPETNASLGTDHGRAGLAFVVGDNVRGGLYGEAPSLSSFDAHGNLVPTVDLRSLYASVLSGWMGGDDAQVLGATYPKLDLFAAGPGAARPT